MRFFEKISYKIWKHLNKIYGVQYQSIIDEYRLREDSYLNQICSNSQKTIDLLLKKQQDNFLLEKIDYHFDKMSDILQQGFQSNSDYSNRLQSHQLNHFDKIFDVLQRGFQSNSDCFNYLQSHQLNHYELKLELLKNQILLNKDLNIFKNFTNDIGFYPSAHMAQDSNDCLYPVSTADGALRKPALSYKIKNIFKEQASFLDIGCGAGGLVFDALMNGITAFGIDGATYNQETGNGYWGILKDNLSTCDATKPFEFKKNNEKFLFKVISSWECLEHIPENIIDGFLRNVYDNLDNDGYFIGSISRLPYEDNGVVYHVTLKDEPWWREQFLHAQLEFIPIESSPFSVYDFSRGIGSGWQDLHTNYLKNTQDGFLFVAKKISA